MPSNGSTATLMKSGINGVLGTLGLHLGRVPRGITAGAEVITGSFPPYRELHLVGRREDYFIQAGYQPRLAPQYFDDTAATDDSQDEVYRFAKEIADRQGLASVVDIGCGSGYKLLKYFREHTTIGLDVPETCAVLQRRYPERQWGVSDFRALPVPQAELAIASDVIEHLADPDELLDFIQRIHPAYLVLSTPDRNLLRCGTHKGPPANPAHLREWSMAELHAYLSERFEILEHFISYAPQGTQCVLAQPRIS
jgi:SAM-dependent methyltransferase